MLYWNSLLLTNLSRLVINLLDFNISNKLIGLYIIACEHVCQRKSILSWLKILTVNLSDGNLRAARVEFTTPFPVRAVIHLDQRRKIKMDMKLTSDVFLLRIYLTLWQN